MLPKESAEEATIAIAQALSSAGLLRQEVDESKYAEAIKWIEKSDHQNGCSWSRKLPQYSKCDCGKLKILNKEK